MSRGTFVPGQAVRIAPHTRIMTVETVDIAGYVHVVWYDRVGALQRAMFKPRLLTLEPHPERFGPYQRTEP